MIAPFRALWKQFTGSQINAVMQALWEYFYDTYDATLEYWRKLKIASATSDHLTFIGILQGIARPLIPIPEEDYLVFSETYGLTEDPENPSHLIPDAGYPSKQGFGSVEYFSEEINVGRFADVKQAGRYNYVNTALFRQLLQANSASTGLLGSLVTLDDMLYSAWKMLHPITPPVYRFDWAKQRDNAAFVGDLVVDLGVTGDWDNPYEIEAEVRLLGKTVYYPVPKIVPKLVVGDGSVDPIGLVRILLNTNSTDPDDIIYGLNSMWKDEGTPSDFIDNGEDPQWEMAPLTQGELATMWAGDNTWIDAEGPAEEFMPLTEEDLQEMWS